MTLVCHTLGIEGISGLRAEYGVSEIPVFNFREWRRTEIKKDHPTGNRDHKNFREAIPMCN